MISVDQVRRCKELLKSQQLEAQGDEWYAVVVAHMVRLRWKGRTFCVMCPVLSYGQ